ncbi:MAG: CoA ester lyase [Pseudomonadales bacterium]|nr:CoA ester lyase [Pseudomonadales bacterium]
MHLYRSILYMPGVNVRAMAKAKQLDCDAVIFDLEDAVSPEGKVNARTQVVETVKAGGFGHRGLIVRVNGLDTPWGEQDIAACGNLALDAMLFPKIESAKQVHEIILHLERLSVRDLPIWLMVETPAGVLNLGDFAAHPRVQALVMGTSDLVTELRASHLPNRENIHYALQHCLLVARSAGKLIFDGVHLDFRNEDSFSAVCHAGRAMGFDGKTLIHPTQISQANQVFGYSEQAIALAHRLLEVWRAARAEGQGVAVLDGRLIENLHAAEAQRVVAFADALASRSPP